MPISLNDLINDISVEIYKNEFLDLSNQNIDDEGVEALAFALSENSYIKRVNLYNNQIGDEGARLLSELPLTELNLSENNIGPEGAHSLSTSEIISLDLSCNPIGSKGASHFSDSQFIRKLLLSECEIGSDGAKGVLKNTKIEIIDLSTNGIGDEGLKEIAENSRIESLKLSQNKIASAGANSIVEKCKKLTTLFLDSNRLGDDGAKKFVNSSTIKFLDLTQNGITRTGFLEICKNNTIKNLRLFNNSIRLSKEDTLDIGNSLTYLNLSGNELDDTGMEKFESSIKISNLGTVDLRHNNIGDRGVAILTQYHSGPTSRKIDLTSNPGFKADLPKSTFLA